MFAKRLCVVLCLISSLIACTPAPSGCQPGTVTVPDSLHIGGKPLVVSQWKNLPSDFKFTMVDADHKEVTFHYIWRAESDEINVYLNGEVIQTEIIPVGTAANFALNQRMEDGKYRFRTITIAHCGKGNWSMSAEWTGESIKLPPTEGPQG